jgi:hypothetical protein
MRPVFGGSGSGSLLCGLLLCLLAGPAPAQERPARKSGDLARYDARIKPEDRRHWAFQPVRRPRVPLVKGASWVRNPVDAFVLARLEERGWRPAPPAPSRALLRRVYLDLIGLPPTPEEQEAFLADRALDSLSKVVDRLLSSPRYGERWGRHWLDLVRYAETNGYERDSDRPFVWRYRDYVIRAFNEDKPYDRFIREQLAGDELPDADADSLIATSYLRLGPWDDEPADPKEDHFDQLDDLVSTTALVFLGLTAGCARCHDHKFEPLTMHDYYRLVAVFNGLERPRDGRTERTLPVGSRRQLEELAHRDREVAALDREARTLRKTAGPRISEAVQQRHADIKRRVAALRAATPDLPQGYFLHEIAPRSPVTHLLLRGKASRLGPEVVPGLPAVLVPSQPPFLPPGEQTSRRRLTLARWIADPKNPLTARVIVNRVWQQHFGEGLVRTPSDFGKAGDRPTHPELLDWLADWFVESGWSLKRLHRLLLDSNAYRMSKQWRPECGRADPEDRFLWRVPYRRLEVEAIRDSMLAVSGRLNSKMYGDWTYPEVPKEALSGSSDPDKIWRPFHETEAARRTVYAHIKRSFVVPLLEVFDLCDTSRSGERRLVTTVAPQALSLFNGSFANGQARHFAARLRREAGDDPSQQIERAFLLALCRPPTEAERSALLQYLTAEAEEARSESAADARQRALVQMCRVIFNLNEFVYAD